MSNLPSGSTICRGTAHANRRSAPACHERGKSVAGSRRASARAERYWDLQQCAGLMERSSVDTGGIVARSLAIRPVVVVCWRAPRRVTGRARRARTRMVKTRRSR